jgi:hypothetical protein
MSCVRALESCWARGHVIAASQQGNPAASRAPFDSGALKPIAGRLPPDWVHIVP